MEKDKTPNYYAARGKAQMLLISFKMFVMLLAEKNVSIRPHKNDITSAMTPISFNSRHVVSGEVLVDIQLSVLCQALVFFDEGLTGSFHSPPPLSNENG